MPLPAPSRRQFLSGASLIAAGSALGLPMLPGTAFAQGEDDFTAVSRLLVGTHDMKPGFTQALLAAFRKIDPAFDGKLATLRRLIGPDPVSGDALKAKLAGADSAVAALPQTILTGWYLGVAGSGKDAICVAYVEALANQEVADVLRPQSYAYGAYGSWAKPPV